MHTSYVQDLINWLQTLENYKEEMDRASGRVEMRRSYKVRMIPESGKIERHSDLVKYKYYSGEDGTDGITYVHPISYLNAQELLNKGSFPECMTFSPSECLDLFDVMAVKFGVDAVQNVDPLVLFPGNRFLDREDIQIFNSSISSFILKLENNLENMEKLNEVISHFPGLTKELFGAKS